MLQFVRYAGWGVAALALSSGCISAERAHAHDQLVGLRETLRLAEIRGVGHDPRSADSLKQARLQMNEGQAWIERDPYRAMSALTCAKADADLAFAFEDESRASAEDRRVSESYGVPSAAPNERVIR